MNDPSHQPLDVDEQRAWLIDHKAATSASWSELAKRLDIPSGTLSQFGSPQGYRGDEGRLAGKVFQYRQLLASQADIEIEAPVVPGYFMTNTGQQLIQLLRWSQRGRVVVAALGPGNSKTSTAKHFAACYPNVFIATMTPSTAGVNTMQVEVLDALGERNAVGTPQRLSRQIKERVRDMANPVILIDEAQHLTEKAIEEIRSWHDNTGVGIALFGNESVIQRLEGGNRRAAFAQLYSRVSLRVVRSVPLQGDVDKMAEAWGIHDEKTTLYLRKISMLPGGLRNGTMALELASMTAASEGRAVAPEHLQDAWAMLSSRAVTA